MKEKKNFRGGYSLIELLAALFIIAIVITIIITSVTSRINISKEIGNNLTENNITEASIAYLKEFESSLSSWKYEYDEQGNPDTSSKYYCITVEELINKGYFSSNILSDNIKRNTYIKIIKNTLNQTYTTSGMITPNSEANYSTECNQYTVTFIDKEGDIININGKNQQMIVDSGYKLTSDDFPNITTNSEYYSFQEGSSKFIYNGKWEDEEGDNITTDYTVKRDMIIKIKYSLESGNGDAYLLKKGQQRPFAGESDENIRYDKGADIILTDNNGTSLADFVLSCEDTSNCVLTLNDMEIYDYLTIETRETLSTLEKNSSNTIDWYVLKYVSGTWHLDGQIHSDFTIGFINLSRLTNNPYANCKYINNNSTCNYSDGYNLAITTYNDNTTISSVTITYNNNLTTEYNTSSLTKVEDDSTIFTTGIGYYTNNKISKTNSNQIKTVTINYQENNQPKQAIYKYTYNNGIYIFELI